MQDCGQVPPEIVQELAPGVEFAQVQVIFQYQDAYFKGWPAKVSWTGGGRSVHYLITILALSHGSRSNALYK